MGYGSMLSAVFKSVLPVISISPVLHVLLWPFQAEAPSREVRPPSWDLNIVSFFFTILVFSVVDNYFITGFDPQDVNFASLTAAKRGGEIQALSRRVSFSSSAAGLSYVPELMAKSESALRPLSRSFEVPSLGDLVVGMPEDLLRCPVRAFSEYLDCTSGVVNRPRRLFVSSKCPSMAMFKNDISYMLRAFIIQLSASSRSGQVPRAPSISGIATSSAFFRNWSLRSALEVAS